MVSTTFNKKIIRTLAFLIFVPMISACKEGNVREDPLPKPTEMNTLQPTLIQFTLTPSPVLVMSTPTQASFSSLPSVVTQTPLVFPTEEEISSLDDGIVRIEVGEYFVDPPVITITIGTTIEWVPTGEREHTIISMDNHPGWLRDGSVGEEGSPSFRATFRVPGVYPYFCSNHPSVMDGKIVVIGENASESP